MRWVSEDGEVLGEASSVAETATERPITADRPIDWLVTVEGDGLATLRSSLEAAREAGVPFDEAWEHSRIAALAWTTGTKLRSEWSAALNETRGAWRGAYYRVDAPKHRLTMELLTRAAGTRHANELVVPKIYTSTKVPAVNAKAAVRGRHANDVKQAARNLLATMDADDCLDDDEPGEETEVDIQPLPPEDESEVTEP